MKNNQRCKSREKATCQLFCISNSGDPKNNEKSRQSAENKQTFDLTGKRKIQIEGKSRQSAELKINKLLNFRQKLKMMENLVKTLKINKFLIRRENLKRSEHCELALLAMFLRLKLFYLDDIFPSL